MVEFYSCQSSLFFLPSSNNVCSAVFLLALFAMSKILSLVSVMPIIERHHKAAMYLRFIEAMALTLVDMPITYYPVIVQRRPVLLGWTSTQRRTILVRKYVFSRCTNSPTPSVVAYSSGSSSSPDSWEKPCFAPWRQRSNRRHQLKHSPESW